MNITKVCEGVWQISENLPNTAYFEGIWVMPNGVSVNSFLVHGEKGDALIDGVAKWSGSKDSLCEILEKAESSFEKLKYLIINHMEPDHSAWLDPLLKLKPDIEIFLSQKGKGVLKAFFGRDDVNVVSDGEVLDMGNRQLKFVMNPNIHWPETMLTYDEKSGCVFSCDGFGSYGAVSENGYDDCLSEEELGFYEDEAFGYYSNVMAICSKPVESSIKKVRELGAKIICPGHGIVWRKDPERILKLYEELSACQNGKAGAEITLIWGSMYGFSEMGVRRAVETLEKSGIKHHIFRVPKSEEGLILKACWRSQGIILGMPTYEYHMFPPMASVLNELGKKKVFGRKAFRLGSYGWSGGAEKELLEIMEGKKMNWSFLPSVEYNGRPSEEDLKAIEDRVNDLIKSLE